MAKLGFKLPVVKDYPKPGVNFVDINPLLADPVQFNAVINAFCDIIKKARVQSNTAIIAPEARGFLFAAPVAHALGLPLVLIRKQGKIPNKPYVFHITNEYTNYNVETDSDLLKQFDKFIYIDDILATGQTLAAVRRALHAQGKEITLAIHLKDISALKQTRDKNKDLQELPSQIIL